MFYYERTPHAVSLSDLFCSYNLLEFSIYVSLYLPYIKKYLGVVTIKVICQEYWFMK